MARALIALGANLPRPGSTAIDTLAEALSLLQEDTRLLEIRVSRWYRSPAEPPGSGPDFVNGAAVFKTSIAPDAVLERLHHVERRLGRTRPGRWTPRVCDLDLIALDDLVLPDRDTQAHWAALTPEEAGRRAPEGLVLPHPRMQERAFVLCPLAEVAPDWCHPVTGLGVGEMIARLPERLLAATQPI